MQSVQKWPTLYLWTNTLRQPEEDGPPRWVWFLPRFLPTCLPGKILCKCCPQACSVRVEIRVNRETYCDTSCTICPLSNKLIDQMKYWWNTGLYVMQRIFPSYAIPVFMAAVQYCVQFWAPLLSTRTHAHPLTHTHTRTHTLSHTHRWCARLGLDIKLWFKVMKRDSQFRTRKHRVPLKELYIITYKGLFKVEFSQQNKPKRWSVLWRYFTQLSKDGIDYRTHSGSTYPLGVQYKVWHSADAL